MWTTLAVRHAPSRIYVFHSVVFVWFCRTVSALPRPVIGSSICIDLRERCIRKIFFGRMFGSAFFGRTFLDTDKAFRIFFGAILLLLLSRSALLDHFTSRYIVQPKPTHSHTWRSHFGISKWILRYFFYSLFKNLSRTIETTSARCFSCVLSVIYVLVRGECLTGLIAIAEWDKVMTDG